MMSIKKEEEIIIDDGPESGQCSDDETERQIMQRKSKKHKKRSKGVKMRKRKYSTSTSSSTKTEIEFFNPYSVSADRYICKSENIDPFIENFEKNSPNQDLTNDIYNDQINDNNYSKIAHISNYEVPQQESMPGKSVDSQVSANRRKALYLFDKTGIESTEADLRYFLLDFGFSNALVSDVYSSIYHMQSPEPEHKFIHDDEEVEENEDEMFNDLPIIDTSRFDSHDDLYANSYSPEPANNVFESYKVDQGLISYAPKPLNEIIDLNAIPEVGPKDPRLNQGKPLAPKLSNQVPKFQTPVPVVDSNVEKSQPKPVENNVPVNKEWEVAVASMVKTHLRLYLLHNDINKDEYKSILKRAVNKIISSGEKKLETDKISKFLHSYVVMMQKSRFVDGI